MTKSRTVFGAAVKSFVKYGGIKALGAIMSSRKGIFGLLAIVASYWFLLGRLPEDAPVELITNMAEVFGVIVGGVAGLFIGGTALEDGLTKKGAVYGPYQYITETTNIESSGGSGSADS